MHLIASRPWRFDAKGYCRQADKNRRLNKNSSTGIKGVYYVKKKNRWRAEIKADGVRYELGTFRNPDDAAAAYRAAALKYHGQFARLA